VFPCGQKLHDDCLTDEVGASTEWVNELVNELINVGRLLISVSH